MALKSIPYADRETLDQVAGFTGVGWTASLLGYLAPIVGYGNGLVSRVVADPQSLLYVGGLCFLATLGLDRIANPSDDE